MLTVMYLLAPRHTGPLWTTHRQFYPREHGDGSISKGFVWHRRHRVRRRGYNSVTDILSFTCIPWGLATAQQLGPYCLSIPKSPSSASLVRVSIHATSLHGTATATAAASDKVSEAP